ncbi:MAG: serine/threonine-protein kinase [Polyangiales bacterium]
MDYDFDYGAEELDGEKTVVMQAFAPGTFFSGRFQIVRPLGTGGMGNVYEATDILTNETVALKVLKKSALTGDAEERFKREVEILAGAHHPCIIGIRAFGHTEDGTSWLSMECLEGETLRDRVRRLGPMDPKALVPILKAACDALTKAHERGVVHRDLKPDHLFLPSSGIPPVKVLDFGLSLTAGSKKLTKTGTVLGTPRYMAPEQIASAHGSDGKADVYALGVIVYEALSGHSPFAASDHGQLLGAILTGRIEPLEQRRPDLPHDLVRVVEIAMAHKVEERWQTPNEFADAFEKSCKGLPVDALLSGQRGGSRRSEPDDAPRFSLTGVDTPRSSFPEPAFTGPAAAAAAPAPSGTRRRMRKAIRIALLVVGGLAIVTLSALASYFALR